MQVRCNGKKIELGIKNIGATQISLEILSTRVTLISEWHFSMISHNREEVAAKSNGVEPGL